MAEIDENEGMSTGKKVAAGAALGVAVPAAVAVGKKLLGGDEESGDSRGQAQSSSGGRRSPQRTRATSKRARSTGSRSGSRSRSAATKRPASSSSSRRRSTSSGSRSGSTRTKEQLYNQAKRLKIEGRSSMTKAQLERAVSRASR